VAGVERPVLAVCWKDKTNLNFISTFGVTVKGKGFDRPRTKKVLDGDTGNFIDQHYHKHVDAPQIINDIYHGFGEIDIGDHYRQGILFPEEVWKTHMAWHREFSTILGSEVCDAFFLYLLDYNRVHGSIDAAAKFLSWIAFLAKQLIEYEDDSGDANNRNLRKRQPHNTAREPEHQSKVRMY
jgi:hypothetical protein